MTIRTRLTIWYAVTLFTGVLMVGAAAFYELFVEHGNGSGTERALEETAEIVLFGGGPALAAALIGGWFITRRALAPLERLTNAVEQMHMGNLRATLVPPQGNDELARLTRTFNRMTERLEESFRPIREFTLHASHELRTPLALMRAQAETLLADESLTATERERWADLVSELDRLAQIVENLTLLSRADAGLLEMQRSAVPADKLLKDALDDAALLAHSRGVRVVPGEIEPVEIFADARRIRQLLLLLLDNAMKYNRPTGEIRAQLKRGDRVATIAIFNHGEPIAPTDLPRVFERFFRVNRAHSREVEGLGLGLSIAESIVRAHDGTIALRSEGEGVVAEVNLPLAGKA